MSEFKKSFCGYSPDEVDKKIEDLNAHITEIESKKKMLENTVDELKSRERDLNLKITELENEIHSLNMNRIRMENKLSGNNIPTETAGKIYEKAYEIGELLASAPKQHINRLMQNVRSESDKTRSSFNAAQTDFAAFSAKIEKRINEIIADNKTMLERVQNLNNELLSVRKEYSAFDSIEEAVSADMERILNEYKHSIGDPDASITPKDASEKATATAADRRSTESEKRNNAIENADTEAEELTAKKAEAENNAEPNNNNAVKETETPNDGEHTDTVNTDVSPKKKPEPADNRISAADGSEILEDSVADFVSQEACAKQVRGNNIMNLLNKYQKKTPQ